MRTRRVTSFAAALTAVTAAGCGAKLDTGSLGVAPTQSVHAEGPIEIYSRVARGALACWFGPQGSLKKNYVFHADVAPESKGGAAEIIIHEKDAGAPSPRSLRAFKVKIERQGNGSLMATENFKLPEPVARDMQQDLARWAKAEVGCSVVGVGGWNADAKPGAEPEPPPPAAKAGKKKS